MKKILILLLLINSLIYCDSKKILFINSYSRDYRWTEDQLNGILDSINNPNDFDSYYEYLDSNVINESDYIENYKKIFKEKYKNKDFDMIVTTDDFALNFINENVNLLKKVPYIIALGVNGDYSNKDNTSIIYEKFDIIKTLNLINSQNKNIKNIYFVSDNSTSAISLKKDIINSLADIDNFKFVWLSSDYNVLKDQLKNLKSNSALIHLAYYKNGKYKTVIYDLYKNLDIPIYGAYNFQLDKGNKIIGGYLLNGYKIGKEAGLLINEYFSGKKLKNFIKNSDLINGYEFNFEILQKHKIAYIPLKSKLYFEELSYFKDKKYEIIAITTIILSSIVIFFIFRSYRFQLKINEKNKLIWELDESVYKTQKEVIAVLGQIIENRSKETANHTSRVAKISRYLGELMGFDDEEANSIEIASPLHDVGKIGIPESILHKPGKLSSEEFEIIKTHSGIGYEILKAANIPILRISANIAHEHHERWDGLGYPKGKKEEEISIYARITTAADIFDALLSERSYKKPWHIDDVIKYFEEEKGKIFDPKIVDVFLENVDKIIEIRESLKE